MLFHEIYGTYYQTVAEILTAALDHPLSPKEITAIVRDNGFGESTLNIPEALGENRWQLLRVDGVASIHHSPSRPLSALEKRWINAIALDPRMKLFTDEPLYFPEVEPLFRPEDIDVFDQYGDGDPYEEEQYIRNFRLLLDAVRNQYPVKITMRNRTGKLVEAVTIPDHLEYSEKDDKFRVIGTGSKLGTTINLGRILSCEKSMEPENKLGKQNSPRPRSVVMELTDERKALERVLLHFAHYEKQVEKLSEGRYVITLYYDKEDETELLIRILSFGPMLKVVKPSAFIRQIRKRLYAQMSCGL